MAKQLAEAAAVGQQAIARAATAEAAKATHAALADVHVAAAAQRAQRAGEQVARLQQALAAAAVAVGALAWGMLRLRAQVTARAGCAGHSFWWWHLPLLPAMLAPGAAETLPPPACCLYALCPLQLKEVRAAARGAAAGAATEPVPADPAAEEAAGDDAAEPPAPAQVGLGTSRRAVAAAALSLHHVAMSADPFHSFLLHCLPPSRTRLLRLPKPELMPHKLRQTPLTRRCLPRRSTNPPWCVFS